MKKIIAMLICMIMVFALAACGATSGGEGGDVEGEGGGTQIPNPFTDCGSLAEAIEFAGFAMVAPESIEGFGSVIYRAIEGSMIEIVYKSGEDEICIRKAVGTEDPSGDYSNYSELDTISIGGFDVEFRGEGGKVCCAVWNDGTYAFSVTALVGGEGLAREIITGHIVSVA